MHAPTETKEDIPEIDGFGLPLQDNAAGSDLDDLLGGPMPPPLDASTFMGVGNPLSKSDFDELLFAAESAPAAPRTKTCPMCAETILENARKCKHCGEMINNQSQVHFAEKSGAGIPKPRSFLTTALLAGGVFGVGIGVFSTIQKGAGFGILSGLASGPLFGFVMAFFVSGTRVAVQYADRDAFINEISRAFQKIKHELVTASDPLFAFKHQQGAAFMLTTHVHVGRGEALFVGPRIYVKKCVRRLSAQHKVDWTGKKLKENHGESPPDTAAQFAWIAAVAVLLAVSWGIKEMSSPTGKAEIYVRSRLKAPSEAKFISTKIVGRDERGTRVEVVFEAPNSFGAKLRDSMTVMVKSDGSVSEF